MQVPEKRYLIEDILTVKYGGNKRLNRKLASQLVELSDPRCKIRVVSSFMLGDLLLVIGCMRMPDLKRLIVLDRNLRSGVQIKHLARPA